MEINILDDIYSHHVNDRVKNTLNKNVSQEDQCTIISEIDCLTYETASKTNSEPANTKVEEKEKIPVPGNASYFDLSKQNLKTFPTYLYEQCVYIKFLYLEGNFIVELDDCFFPSLPSIKWLDIRNNLLENLPKTIINHPNLEILLLQDNKLQTLPLELGLVPKLRGLQLIGNPLKFPPKDVLEKGVKYIIEFLQEEHSIQAPSPNSIRPIGENFYKGLEAKGLPPVTERKFKSKSGNAVLQRKSSIKLRKRAASTSFPSLDIKSYQAKKSQKRTFPSTSVYKLEEKWAPSLNDVTNEDKSFKDLRKKNQYTGKNLLQLRSKTASSHYYKNRMEVKIQNVLLREQIIAKIKELMERQYTIIQRWKDEETLKKWRRNSVFCSKQRGTVSEPPFGTDPDFMVMLSRNGDVNPARARQRQKKAQEQKAVRDVQQEMSEIIHSLQKLGKDSKNTEISPRTHQSLLCTEIQTLMDLQKKLQALKLRNSHQDLPPLAPSLPVRGQKMIVEQQKN